MAIRAPLREIARRIGARGDSGLPGVLINEKKLAPASLVITAAALRFLYTVTLKHGWSVDTIIPAPKRPKSLPAVLSPEEVSQFLDCVKTLKHRWTPAHLLSTPGSAVAWFCLRFPSAL